ncbi:hypothetical protein B0H17DRAFT_1216381 [Mycena rosella]|uniref:Uncharacterized protein n=1 Tax=Mycena rosella TaxID=1033263 RepID=A0AAD7C9E3_MYCRO|nr:hypothetical protein B0H17DRAFT_1216381 [Mycena rosella]
MLSRFLNGWIAHGTAVESSKDSSRTADIFPGLRDSATEIIHHVLDFAEQSGFSHEQVKWTMEYDSGPLKISHLIALHDWLVETELMIGGIQRKPDPAAKKAAQSATPSVKISHEGKQITMTPAMLIEARTDPSSYPGCVEAGMDTVSAVLTNRNNRQKCISCDALRGKALDERVIPPKADHPFLADCKCSLRGAALELWMIKMTAQYKDIPQRIDDDITNRRLSLNPDILKLIAGGIQAASGHDVDTLLQPEHKRLEHTIHWALQRLHAIASEDGSMFADSFHFLSNKLTETLKSIATED